MKCSPSNRKADRLIDRLAFVSGKYLARPSLSLPPSLPLSRGLVPSFSFDYNFRRRVRQRRRKLDDDEGDAIGPTFLLPSFLPSFGSREISSFDYCYTISPLFLGRSESMKGSGRRRDEGRRAPAFCHMINKLGRSGTHPPSFPLSLPPSLYGHLDH